MRGTLGRLLRLTAPFGWWMTLAVFLGFATIGSSIGLLATSAYLISKAAVGYRLWPVSARPSIAELQLAIVGVRFFGISRGVFRYLERYVSHEVTFRLLARLRAWFYQVLEPLAPARLAHFRSGDLLARSVADIETLENVFLRVLQPAAVAMLVTALAGVLLGSHDLCLAAILLPFLVAAGVGVPLLTRMLSRGMGRRLVQARADLNSALVDGIQGVAELLAFGGEDRHLDRVAALTRESGGLQRQMARIEGLQGALTGLLMNLAVLAVLAVAIPLVTGAQLDGVYLALLALVVIASFEAVLPLPLALQRLDGSMEAARRLFEIVDTEPAVADPHEAASAPHENGLRRGLRVENLSFAYEDGAAPALDGISLDLPQGGLVAIVGPSGAGKSTLANLLLRFWDYQSGRILLAGRDLREYAQEDVRQIMAVVSQRTDLFNGTVRDNLLLAWPDADEHDLVQAAQRAQIHEFIQSLPQDYDTWIGEQGLRLSSGQRQRLAIARAILKDAPILILDEPTANLDALTEKMVMEGLQSLAVGRTTLLMTHRLVGLEAADEILVLRAGRVVERGQHHELMQLGGLYRRMWELQTQVLSPVTG